VGTIALFGCACRRTTLTSVLLLVLLFCMCRDDMDRTALHWAAQLGVVQIAQQLLVAAAATAVEAAADMAAAAEEEGAPPEFPSLTELQV
jgi:hypothetical protein